ncbi:hypothetical protein [Rubellicoccus peritrichatus]|uniref:Uncharacterized protein n=1 Tax=Rubellicoccus peritrichatus TaxID=3080537 RepID=A0AAQ3QXR6_9BACT|nr:hypothetical protein [Puniceicoccus sp. CR14]WOO43125.1 hypothetical protein RZN69_08470 [Puniceicoccus sp. CR14]
MSGRWTRIERGVTQAFPNALSDEDVCWYAREYVKSGGYSASDGNQLIANFKMSPNSANYASRQFYKDRACSHFAKEVANALLDNVSLCVIPTSKKPDSPEFDPRWMMFIRELRRIRSDLIIESPFEIIESHQCAHHGGDRGTNVFYNKLRWLGLTQMSDSIVVIDDVITSGNHFVDCKRMLLENSTVRSVYGLFWALAIDPPDDDQLELLEF